MLFQLSKTFAKQFWFLHPLNEHTYHLTNDQILGHVEVDLTTENLEDMFRAKIAQAVEQLAHGIKPDDLEFVKVQSK